MTDFAAARRNMVDGQLRTNDVTDSRILGAMLAVPRERFVPSTLADVAYLDLDLPVGQDAPARRMLKPMLLGKLLQAGDIGATARVLAVGCATGYSAAILSQLADSVVALEENSTLGAQARGLLSGYRNVTVEIGRLVDGWRPSAPYDVILLDGGSEIEPANLFPQLAPDGRLICLQGKGPAGKAMIYRRTGGSVSGRAIFDAAAIALPGFERPPVFVF